MEPDSAGRFGENIAHFGRALRAAGLPVGTDRILQAVRAVRVAGFTRREDFFWTLHACLVSRAEHRVVFERAFGMFWRDPEALAEALAIVRAGLRIPPSEKAEPPGARRAAEAIAGNLRDPARTSPPRAEDGFEVDARLTASSEERLRRKDFESMSAEEERRARRVVERLRMPVPPLVSRRLRPVTAGRRPDWRATMRAMMRAGGTPVAIRHRGPDRRPPDLVALCDISGSMASYARMLLVFLHAVSNARNRDWGRVFCFTFGTRLTDVSRWLRARDGDEALARIGEVVPDWEGGTRIGSTLHAFNRDWSRRALSQGAVVLLLTDGLDRGDPELLAREAARLRRSARRVVWLNPLLRWKDFAPKARGVAGLLPHVDAFRGVYNIETLEELGAALSNSGDQGEKLRMLSMLREAA